MEREERAKAYRGNTKDGLGVDVRRGSPVLLEDAVRTKSILVPKRSSEFLVSRLVVNLDNGLGQFAFPHKLRLNLCQLRTAIPNFNEVADCDGTRSSTNDVKHPFSGIGIGRAGRSTIPLKVVDESARVGTDVTIVDGSASASEEEKTVEFLEEESGRLMNRAKDGLSIRSELSEEFADRPGGLTVQARRWFVEEEKELRLRGKFDTDSKSFALLDVET